MRHKTAGFVRVFSGRPAVGRLDGIGQALLRAPHRVQSVENSLLQLKTSSVLCRIHHAQKADFTSESGSHAA